MKKEGENGKDKTEGMKRLGMDKGVRGMRNIESEPEPLVTLCH